MAEITKEIISFEIDAEGAARETDRLIKQLELLTLQEKQLAKSGKDVSAVQKQIQQTTQSLNKILTEEVSTQKALTKQTEATAKAIKTLQNSQNGLENSTQKAEKSQLKLASSLARASGRVTNIGGALGLAAGGLATFTGAAELGGIALGLVAAATSKAFEALDAYLFPVNEATKLSQELAGAYVQESADLFALGNIITDTTTKTDDRGRAIDALNEQYGKYLPNLLTEKSSNEEVRAAIEAVNEAIIDRILLEAKREKAFKLVSQVIEEQTRLSNLATDADLARNKTLAKLGAGLGATLLGPLGVILSQTETAGEIVTNTVEEVTKSSINANIDAAKEQLKNLDKTFEDVKANLKDISTENLASASTITKESLKQQEQAQKNADKLKEKDKKTNEALKGSLADLEAQLAKVNKQLNEQTALGDNAKLEQLGKTYQDLKKQVEAAKQELERFKGEQEKINIINRGNDLGTIERLGVARDLRQSELELKKVIADIDEESADTEAQKRDLQLSRLRNEVFLLGVQRQLAELNQQDTAALDKQIQLTTRKRDLLALEIPLQQVLTQQQQDLTRLEIEQIKATTDPKRQELENGILEAKIQILQTEIAIAEVQGQNTLELEKQLATLQAQQEQAGADKVKEQAEKVKQTAETVINGVADISGQVVQAVIDNTNKQLQAIDGAIAKTQSRLDELTNSQENVSAEQIRIEQERLDKLQAKREEAAAKEEILIKSQIAAQAALTVAKAAAEGGGLASAFTIAAAVASLIIGFTQAGQVAENAFYKGTMFVERGNNPSGIDTIPARLTEGESVMPADTTRKYNNALRAIYENTIPAEAINSFAENYKSWKNSAPEMPIMNLFVNKDKKGGKDQRQYKLLETIAKNTAQTSSSTIKITKAGVVKMVTNTEKQSRSAKKRNA